MNEYHRWSKADIASSSLIYRYKLWSTNTGAILGFDCIISEQKVSVRLVKVGHRFERKTQSTNAYRGLTSRKKATFELADGAVTNGTIVGYTTFPLEAQRSSVLSCCTETFRSLYTHLFPFLSFVFAITTKLALSFILRSRKPILNLRPLLFWDVMVCIGQLELSRRFRGRRRLHH